MLKELWNGAKELCSTAIGAVKVGAKRIAKPVIYAGTGIAAIVLVSGQQALATAWAPDATLLPDALATTVTTALVPYITVSIAVGAAFAGVGLVIGLIIRRGPKAAKGRG
jgi:hypothetical protein